MTKAKLLEETTQHKIYRVGRIALITDDPTEIYAFKMGKAIGIIVKERKQE